MKELFFILIIIGILLLIYRRLARKVRGSDCGAICQLIRKPSLPKKSKTCEENKKEARKAIERIKKERK